VIDLFERALTAGKGRRDAGTLQAYGLYVATKLGDLEEGRRLLKKGTEADRRDPAIWQAWGVLETRYGSPEAARKVFQQGIWNCAQTHGGNSGGRRCARLWQAWGVLEEKEGDIPAARRCFSRAVDAEARNVPAVVAWAFMEMEDGRKEAARTLFERALRRYEVGGNQKKRDLWIAYEKMEEKSGDEAFARVVRERGKADRIGSQQRGTVRLDGGGGGERGEMRGEMRGTRGSTETRSTEIRGAEEEGKLGDDVIVWNGADQRKFIEGHLPKSKIKKKSKTLSDDNYSDSGSDNGSDNGNDFDSCNDIDSRNDSRNDSVDYD